MKREVIATIDMAAFRHNLDWIKSKTSSKVMAMVKSRAYGHGALRAAKALCQADAFGVACIQEAQELATLQLPQPIVVLSGFDAPDSVTLFDQKGWVPVFHSSYQLEYLKQNPFQRDGMAWLKIDTGMRRLGFYPEFVHEAYHQLKQYYRSVGLMSHFADADNLDPTFTARQIERFMQVTDTLEGEKSIANSAGLLFYPEVQYDMIRPGIMLYGASPAAHRTGLDLGLKPVMTLTARLLSIKECQPGDQVGYGCTWKASEKTLIGIVGIGYGDGYPRHAQNGTPTLVRGQICPLVGRVSMDLITIDLRLVPDAKVGDSVTLWGEGLPIEHVAASSETISYELMCRLTSRVQFKEVNH